MRDPRSHDSSLGDMRPHERSRNEGYHRMSELTLIIGNKNYSSWSLRPWILMRRLGLEFRRDTRPAL